MVRASRHDNSVNSWQHAWCFMGLQVISQSLEVMAPVPKFLDIALAAMNSDPAYDQVERPREH
jgi:hypothetical protein